MYFCTRHVLPLALMTRLVVEQWEWERYRTQVGNLSLAPREPHVQSLKKLSAQLVAVSVPMVGRVLHKTRHLHSRDCLLYVRRLLGIITYISRQKIDRAALGTYIGLDQDQKYQFLSWYGLFKVRYTNAHNRYITQIRVQGGQHAPRTARQLGINTFQLHRGRQISLLNYSFLLPF